ncbi:MAG: class B sortase [Actinomycetes bacterium]|nr:class B sortase [Actinomycetes bacterium]
MSKFVRGLVLVIAIGVMAFAGYQLGNIAYDYVKDEAEYEELRAIADSPEDATDEATDGDTDVAEDQTVNPDAEFSLSTYLRALLGKAKPGGLATSGNQSSSSLAKAQKRKINFKKLQKKNKEIIAWIYIPNTRIDYPVTRHSNNKYYLKRNAVKKKSSAGSIFLDSKAKKDLSGLDSPIYGHHMRNKSMFGSLNSFRTSKFRKKHQYVYVYTPKATKKYKVSTQFTTKKKKLSAYKGKVRVVTLVTCEYTAKNAHYVLRAKLVSSKKPGKK